MKSAAVEEIRPDGLMKLLLLCFAVPSLAVPLAVLTGSTDSTLLKLLAFVSSAGMMSLLLAFRIASGRAVSMPYPPAAGVILSLLVLYSSVRFALSPTTSLGTVRVLILGSSLAVFHCISMLGRAAGTGRILGLVLAGGAAGFAASLVSSSGAAGLLPFLPEELSRMPGTLCNANLLGSYAGALLVPGVLFLSGRSWRAAYRLAAATAFAAVAVASLSFSGTRSSIAGLLASVVTALLLASRRRTDGRRPPGALPAAWLAAACIPAALLLNPRLSLLSTGGTIGARLTIWEGALGMIGARPLFGWGAGSFQAVFPLFRPADYALHGLASSTAHAHSELLEILVESGLAGAAGWILLAVLATVTVLRSRELTATGAGAFCGAVFLVVESFTSVALRWTPSAFLLAVLPALALAETGTGMRKLPRIAAALPALAGILLLSLGAPSAWRMIQASRHLYRASSGGIDRLEDVLAGDPSDPVSAWRTAASLSGTSVEESRRAVECDPLDCGAWYTLGNAHLARASLLALEVPMRGALLEQGMTPDLPAATREVGEALAAYDSLARLAPDHADAVLNLIHAYVRLGRFDDAAVTAWRAACSRDHEREYCSGIMLRTAPLCSGHRAWLAVAGFWTGLMDLPGEQGEMQQQRRIDRLVDAVRLDVALAAHRSPAEADSLVSGLEEAVMALEEPLSGRLLEAVLAERALCQDGEAVLEALESGDTLGLAGRCRAVLDSTDALAPLHGYVLLSLSAMRGDASSATVASDLLFAMKEFGMVHAGFWPGHGDHLVSAALIATAGAETDVDLLAAALAGAVAIDAGIARTLGLASIRYDRDARCPPLEGLVATWSAVGGPEAARMITGDGIPWRPGSHTERLAQILEDAAARSPDSPGLQGLRLGFYSELLAGHEGEDGFADVEARLADSRARISLMDNGDRALERAADFASSI